MLLHDKPEASEFRFGHKVISDWLAKQIAALRPPFRLAITGGLGTGKSTILHAAIEQLQREMGKKLAVAYVDVWKLDKESVRRNALIRIAKDLIGDKKEEEKVRETLYGTFSEASRVRPFEKTLNKTGLTIAACLFAAIAGITLWILSMLHGTNDEPLWLRGFISAAVAILAVATRVLERSFVHIQRTFNRAPMVGAEEFEEGLQKILDSPTAAGKRTIIVFDNVDRASPDSARAILAGLSAFFDHSSHACVRDVLIIVPFDPNCLKDASTGERALYDDTDKMFDAILPLPKLTTEDLTDFAHEKLQIALHTFKYSEDTLRNLAYLVSFSPFKSPREIKHMVNQLVGRLALAMTLESRTDERLTSGSTLLPEKTITNCPDTLLKLLICEKIFPPFTELVVTNGIELKRAFDPEDDSIVLTTISDQAIKSSLATFLNSTIGIPKIPPQSAAPFLYMKGPDQVLAIPAGQSMSEALHMGDAISLASVIKKSKEGSVPVSHDNIAAVLRYHRKKHAKNQQALKNSVRAIFGGLADCEPFNKDLVIEICETLTLVPDILLEVSPRITARYTSDYLEVSAVKRVWKLLDSEFESASSPQRLSTPEGRNWAAQYIEAVFAQPQGKERSGIYKRNIPLALLIMEEVEAAIGTTFPGTYCSREDGLEATKLYLNTNNPTLAQKYLRVLEGTFSTIPDFEGCEKILQEISATWQTSAESWLNNKTPGDTSEKISTVVYHWPIKNQKGKAPLNEIKTWVSNRLAQLQKKCASGGSVDVLDLCLSLYSNNIPAEANLDIAIQHALANQGLDKAGLLQLEKRYSDAKEMVWEVLCKRAPSQLVQCLDRTAAFDLPIADQAECVIPHFLQAFASLKQKGVLFTALMNSKIALDIIKPLFLQFTEVKSDARVPYIQCAKKTLTEADPILVSAVEHFILNPDDSNLDVFNEVARNLNSAIKKQITEKAIEFLTANRSAWGIKECSVFSWALLSPDEITDFTLRNMVDLALEYGVQRGQDNEIKESCSDTILKLWEINHAFSEKSFKIFKKTAPNIFEARIETLADRHGIKDSLKDMVDNLVTQIKG